MSKIKKAKQALLNRAMRNPDLFKFETRTGEGVTVTYIETGESSYVEPSDGVIMMGCSLELWADSLSLPKLSVEDGSYGNVWSELKYRRKEI